MTSAGTGRPVEPASAEASAGDANGESNAGPGAARGEGDGTKDTSHAASSDANDETTTAGLTPPVYRRALVPSRGRDHQSRRSAGIAQASDSRARPADWARRREPGDSPEQQDGAQHRAVSALYAPRQMATI